MSSADRAQDGADRPATRGRRSAYEVLAVASRALVLEQVRGHPAGVDTAALARDTGLHPNTVRFHLDVLVEAGLITVASDPAGKPGRPRLLFSLARIPPPAPPDPPDTSRAPAPPAAPAPANQDGYALLAEALAQHLCRTSADPGAAAQAAGRLWVTDRPGEEGMNPAASHARPSPDADTDADTDAVPVAHVSALFDELGFAPQAVRDGEGWRILLHQCPFHALAAEHPEVVCRLHLGLLQGAVDRLGHRGAAVRLQPFVAPGLCEAFVPLTALTDAPTTPAAGHPALPDPR